MINFVSLKRLQQAEKQFRSKIYSNLRKECARGEPLQDGYKDARGIKLKVFKKYFFSVSAFL
jgi:hypothetical protein